MTDHRVPDLGPDPPGATPLSEEQQAGLRMSWVATRADLNQVEAANITQARTAWRRRAAGRGSRRLSIEVLLDHVAVRRLHADMFGDVWGWAGTYRLSDTNIGVPWHRVQVDTVNLLADAVHWFTGAVPMPLDHAAARLHHRLVEIHPFPNGNGRHAREMADLALMAMGAEPFTWGRGTLIVASTTRRAYIDALIEADHGTYTRLYDFVRS